MLILLFAGFLFFSCDPDRDERPGNNSTDEHFRENFGSQVNRNFFGQVVDANNDPIIGVTVKIGSSSAQTDANGIFQIQNAQVYQKFAYIKASKTGYIDGSRSMIPTSGTNNVKIMLLESGALETVHSGQESEVSIYSGTKVKFDGAFEDVNGNPYSGSVDVFMFHLTPSDPNIGALQPGMLYAETEGGTETGLETFGMMNVELRGSGGQKLQIAKGHTAEITMRIDDAQLATAAPTIPLWHFDENAGWWKEDGIATKQGNYYVGEVSHCSWWNCDVPTSMNELTIRVKNPAGQPLPNVAVQLQASGMFSNVLTTDSQGVATGYALSGVTLTASLSACQSIASEIEIGPYVQGSVNVEEITITAENQLEVTGSILNCNGQLMPNGYVQIIDQYATNYFPIENGVINASVVYCLAGESYTMNVFDDLGNSYTFNVTSNGVSQNFGTILVCDEGAEYVSYQIDNEPVVVLSGEFNAGQNNQTSGFHINSSNTSGSLAMVTNVTSVGSYTTEHYSIQGLITLNSGIPNDILLGVSQFGAVDEFINCTFEGTFTDQTGTHTVNGLIHVLRDY